MFLETVPIVLQLICGLYAEVPGLNVLDPGSRWVPEKGSWDTKWFLEFQQMDKCFENERIP